MYYEVKGILLGVSLLYLTDGEEFYSALNLQNHV